LRRNGILAEMYDVTSTRSQRQQHQRRLAVDIYNPVPVYNPLPKHGTWRWAVHRDLRIKKTVSGIGI